MQAPSNQSPGQIVAMEAANFQQIQISKWAFLYTLNIAVPNNSTIPANLVINNDADFKIVSLTGSCYGTCDQNGVRTINGSTDFPLAGTAVPSGAGLGVYADRGLMLKITDAGSNRELSSGFVPAETIFTPGYGIAKSVEQPFNYYALRASTIRFDIRNRDTQTGFHFLSIIAYGFKYGVGSPAANS